MKKETLQAIWGYVYNGLAVKTPEGLQEIYFRRGDPSEHYMSFEQLYDKPDGSFAVLYPPSVLTEGVTWRGINYVPLRTMASMCYKPGIDVGSYTVIDSKENFFAIKIGPTIFGYDAEARAFLCIDESKRRTCCIPVKCQWDMFWLMFLHKIDFMGLIDKGEAISVFDMTENPYK